MGGNGVWRLLPGKGGIPDGDPDDDSTMTASAVNETVSGYFENTASSGIFI
jgi:hypothetical protein